MINFFKKIFDVCKAVVGAIWDETKGTVQAIGAGAVVVVVGAAISTIGVFIGAMGFPVMIALVALGFWPIALGGAIARGIVALVNWAMDHRAAGKGAQAHA